MTVFAHPDDETIALGARLGRFTTAHLVQVTDGAPQSGIDSEALGFASLVQAAISRALSSYRVDLVHMHGPGFREYIIPQSLPRLVTLHLPIAWYGDNLRNRHEPMTHYCCVSESQRRSLPRELRNCSVVENGVALQHSPGPSPRGDFALVMGRICPEKNAHAALEAGTLAGTRVLLAGQIFPYREHREYFRDRIEPLLEDVPGRVEHRFLGPLPSAERQQLLAEAKCLLHPTLAPETSSLVAMEALAAGTPVIAYRSGALPDIVEDGVTGFLVSSVDEMAEAMCHVAAISSEDCRRAAERRFTRERMVRSYFDLYRAIVKRDLPEKRYA